MKLTSRLAVLTLLLSINGVSANAFSATPLPMTEPEPEGITVTGTRLPFTGLDTPLAPVPSIGPANGGASTAQRNETQKAKAKGKARDKSWKTVVSMVMDLDVKSFIMDLIKNDVLGVSGVKTIEYYENGNVKSSSVSCTQIAINSKNEDACSRILMAPGPNGTKLIEIQKLIIFNGKLSYSTNDTISFQVESVEEFYQLLNEIDPDINL